MKSFVHQNPGILVLKSKFFLIRLITYFSFLLIPILIPKSLHLNQGLQALMIIFYILFIIGQWFFLGKEIDHRIEVYFRINSSMDRVVYRLFLGKFFFILYFNLISFFSHKWIYNIFWITWVLLGFFYSWPTRGKIIRESVSTNFSEFKYLDRFEKTLVGLIFILFVVSVPELPKINFEEALKFFFDESGQTHTHLWHFLRINYYPFYRYPDLFKLAWSMHFYFVDIGFFLLVLYTFFRFFVSRRLSLLGVFSLLSSWSFSKILAFDYGASYQATYSLLWVWTFMWVIKSSSYRTGLFLGLMNYYGSIINQSWSFLFFIQIVLIYFFFLGESTTWFRRQVLKYSLLGGGLCLFVILTHPNIFSGPNALNYNYLKSLGDIFNQKAFFILALFGIFIFILKYLIPGQKYFEAFKVDSERLKQLIAALAVLFIYGLIFDANLVKNFLPIWVIVLLSLISLEFIFQKMNRRRSHRNMIYLIYMLICLLDSHFEGRVKIFLKIFEL